MSNRLNRLFFWWAAGFCGLFFVMEQHSHASTTNRLSGSPPWSTTGQEAWFFSFLSHPLTGTDGQGGDKKNQGVASEDGGEPGRSQKRGAGIVEISRVDSLVEMTRKGTVTDYGCRSRAASVKDAIFYFWNAFESHRSGDRMKAMAKLDILEAEYGDDPELALIQGLVRLWVINEPDDSTTSLRQASFATQALEYFRKAQRLCPGDARIAGWIAPTEMRLGRAVRAPSLVAEGVATFDHAVRDYPEFNVFTLVLAQATEERSSDAFNEAIQAIHQSFKLCDEMRSDDPACRNGVRVRHNVEGTALLAGDLLTKQGDVNGARQFYEGARRSPDFENWPFQDLLAQRISTIEARARAFGDGNPHNDPPMVSDSPIACASCHASNSPVVTQR